MTYSNTVAHSSGAVVCPDEASARQHRDRATWWEAGGPFLVWRQVADGWDVVGGPRRRWTR